MTTQCTTDCNVTSYYLFMKFSKLIMCSLPYMYMNKPTLGFP